MQRQPDLLNGAFATVIPEQPLLAIEDRIRLVNGVVVPLVLTRPDNGVGSIRENAHHVVESNLGTPRRGSLSLLLCRNIFIQATVTLSPFLWTISVSLPFQFP